MMTTYRILSYNIQTGIPTQNYRQYITRGWQHLLPSRLRDENMLALADLLSDFDFLALQEVDGGSFRSRFRAQGAWLAEHAGLPYYHLQRTRNFGPFAQHGNAILAKTPLHRVSLAPLPGNLPGRGVMLAELDPETVLVNTHLALNAQVQKQQLRYIFERIQHYPNRIVMGDFNTAPALLRNWLRELAPDMTLVSDQPTYPSWHPRTALDHILLSRTIALHDYTVMQHRFSDHLPVSAVIELPKRRSRQGVTSD
ncbi:endonuclease/exonuclease/phosphatase family protein [Salinibius halmophilus]|uniref:endonuclease/exonuclease/phosphatase family protein n=1 Tax=Salinibius halmophilus TaxID=1853216 RepID=UPI000E665E47|nr:endonuclease/exonuclease/phosphatase family protein [Salinibius halmophilus]